MDLISVKHERDDDELGVKKGDVVIMPAVGLFFYQNKADNRALMEAVDVALLAVSVATLGAASSIAMTVIGILEITAATSDILLRNFKENIPPAIADVWADLNLILMAPALVVGSVQLIRAAVTKLSAFIKSATFLKLSKTERAALRLQQKLNEEYLRVVDEIDAAKSLDELDEIKAGLAGKSDELSKGVFEKIEEKRVKLKQQKQLDELDESLKKQQEPEVKEPSTKKVEEEPAANEPKKEEPKSDLDDPGKRGKTDEPIHAPKRLYSPEEEIIISSYKERLLKRIEKNADKFSLIHTDDEILKIVKTGESIELDQKTIDDFLFVSCRNAKPIKSAELEIQMNNWVNVVKLRGFPYKLKDLEHFMEFSDDVLSGLKKLNISTTDVRIQGSALRTPIAKDIDLAVFLSDESYFKILINSFNGKIRKNGKLIDLTDMNHTQLTLLAKDIPHNREYNHWARTFEFAVTNGKIRPQDVKGMDKLQEVLESKFGPLDLSLMRKNSNFNMNPYLKIE